jgi:hypothetical protein
MLSGSKQQLAIVLLGSRRRFFRHKAAIGGMITLLFVVLLAFTSIGIGPIPGWWDKSFLATGTVIDGGRRRNCQRNHYFRRFRSAQTRNTGSRLTERKPRRSG